MANGWEMASKWLGDGWKIALSVKLSSSPYPIHYQPVTPFLEDMADFFTYKLYNANHRRKVCQNSLILKKSQSPDFHKPGLCYV